MVHVHEVPRVVKFVDKESQAMAVKSWKGITQWECDFICKNIVLGWIKVTADQQ